jgi:hypothetical protein
MELKQAGANITGDYNDATRGVKGSLSGTLSGTTLNAKWTEGVLSGPLTLNLDKTGQTINGTTEQQAIWCGAHTDAPFPNGCSFAGAWSTSVAGLDCAMNLTMINTSVTGGDCNGQIKGKVSYGTSLIYLSGTSTGVSGPFTLYLVGNQGLQFRGSFGPNLDRLIEWCGWRPNSSKPIPCFSK